MRTKFDRSQLPARPDLTFEAELWSRGYHLVAGLDEAGRGALAGPVAAGAAVLPMSLSIAASLNGVRDSKQMTANQRKTWAERIRSQAVSCAVGFASSIEIDEHGILSAVRLAMQRALDGLSASTDFLLVDYLHLPGCPVPQAALVKGDARSLSIAAASILAKTARDELMLSLEIEFPGYGFARHKGYGTSQHLQMIEELGLSPQHRQSFHIRAASWEIDDNIR